MSKNETKGWICPKCGRVYAPWIDKCQYCGQQSITYTNTCPYSPWWYCNGGIYTNTTTTDTVTLNANQVNSTTSNTNTGATTLKN